MSIIKYETYFQNKLPKYSLDDIGTYLTGIHPTLEPISEFEVTQLWLGHLCCRGKISYVLEFLKGAEVELCNRYLNTPAHEFWEGTLLHMLLLWNTDCFDDYIAFRELGAYPSTDYYGVLPWEMTGLSWLTPCDHKTYGKRDPLEFASLYQRIMKWEEDTSSSASQA